MPSYHDPGLMHPSETYAPYDLSKDTSDALDNLNRLIKTFKGFPEEPHLFNSSPLWQEPTAKDRRPQNVPSRPQGSVRAGSHCYQAIPCPPTRTPEPSRFLTSSTTHAAQPNRPTYPNTTVKQENQRRKTQEESKLGTPKNQQQGPSNAPLKRRDTPPRVSQSVYPLSRTQTYRQPNKQDTPQRRPTVEQQYRPINPEEELREEMEAEGPPTLVDEKWLEDEIEMIRMTEELEERKLREEKTLKKRLWR